MAKLNSEQKAARTVTSKVAPGERAKVVREASTRVTSKTAIDFRRSVRG
jgi:hypothetical protein